MNAPMQYCQTKIFSLKGRLGSVRMLVRLGLGVVLLLGFVILIAPVVDYILLSFGISRHAAVWAVLFVCLSILLAGFTLTLVIRRLNDIGVSGWWWLVFPMLADTVGFFLLPMLLMLALIPGNKNANRYVLPPPPNTRGVIACAMTCLLLVVVLAWFVLFTDLVKV